MLITREGELLTKNRLLGDLVSCAKNFDVRRFIDGPKGPDDMVAQANDRETNIGIDNTGQPWISRFSVSWLILWGDLLLGEDMRVRKGHVLRGAAEQTGSGTSQREEPPDGTLIREMFGDATTPGELPQLKKLLDANGIALSRQHLDFDMYAGWNKPKRDNSSVFWGFKSIVYPCYVAIDLKGMLGACGYKTKPFKNGTVAYDLGTFIPLSWRLKPKESRVPQNFEDHLHAMNPLFQEVPTAWEDWMRRTEHGR